MTLLELTNAIERLAVASPLIGYAASGSDVYDLNARTVKDYPAVYIMPDGVHTLTHNATQYHLTIFYVDRLVADKTNAEQIFSTGIQVLSNLVRGIRDLDGVLSVGDTVSIQNFINTEQEKLSDVCAGAYAIVNISAGNDTTCNIL